MPRGDLLELLQVAGVVPDEVAVFADSSVFGHGHYDGKDHYVGMLINFVESSICLIVVDFKIILTRALRRAQGPLCAMH